MTDVLSFPQYSSPGEISGGQVILLGDVVICNDVARRQAEEYGHSYEREFVYLFVHSVLHLLGYDHMQPEEKKKMRSREKEIMSYIGLERGFTPAGEGFPEHEQSQAEEAEAGGEKAPEEGKEPVIFNREEYMELMDYAVAASENSYAPYSGFHVGAALLSSDGSVYTGVNIENASFGATICAERSALSAAVSDGCREFEAIAVYSADGHPSPCGICRQVLLEFGEKIKVITYNDRDHLEIQELGDLLPKGFIL